MFGFERCSEPAELTSSLALYRPKTIKLKLPAFANSNVEALMIRTPIVMVITIHNRQLT